MGFGLYKVLNAERRGPFSIGGPVWPMPGGDGSPGAWVERADGGDLYITPCPTRWMEHPESDAVFEVEAEGVKGDVVTSDEILARRVRLVRRLNDEEVRAVSEAWNAEFRRRNGEK